MFLALMQNDVLEASNRRFYNKGSKDFTGYSTKGQSSTNSGILGSSPTDSKLTPSTDTKQKREDKLAALRAQRRKLGLCMKCGEKWGKQHICPAQVPCTFLRSFLMLSVL